MMNQQKMTAGLLMILSLTSLLFLSNCTHRELKALNETPDDFYHNEVLRTQKIIKSSLRSSGQLKAKEMGISTVYMKVIFQKDSTLNPEDPNFIKYQPWWNTKEGLWGFKGVAQKVYEDLSNALEERYGRVTGVNQNMFDTSANAFRRVKYPVKVPTGGIEQKEGFLKYLDLVDVTSYSYGAFHANEGRSIAQASIPTEGGIFFPYFNIFLNKDLAKVSKLNGELVINYKAFVNGYFMFCNHKACEQATLPKNHHLTITVPLPPKRALASTKKQEAINLYAQKHLSKVMTELALTALDSLKMPELSAEDIKDLAK